jgi:hypothetical protein
VIPDPDLISPCPARQRVRCPPPCHSINSRLGGWAHTLVHTWSWWTGLELGNGGGSGGFHLKSVRLKSTHIIDRPGTTTATAGLNLASSLVILAACVCDVPSAPVAFTYNVNCTIFPEKKRTGHGLPNLRAPNANQQPVIRKSRERSPRLVSPGTQLYTTVYTYNKKKLVGCFFLRRFLGSIGYASPWPLL